MYGSDGKPLGEMQIHKLLSKIVANSQDEGPAVGVLTTGNRNTWAKTHASLLKCECSMWSVQFVGYDSSSSICV